MSDTRTTDRQATDIPQEATSRGDIAVFAPQRLQYHPAIEERFGVDKAGWGALIDAVWPLAKTTDSICLALSYCKARKLDPFKKVVHIVPMWSSVQNRMVETVWPGIAELRTTAFRTTEYAGHDPVEYGPDKEEQVGTVTIKFPEWCRMTVHRIVHKHIRAFPGPRVYWLESYATVNRDDLSPNAMWKKRPYGQLEKCAEAAALRAAFPEEIGNEYAAEEMEGKIIDNAPGDVGVQGPRPSRKDHVKPEEPTETYVLVDHTGEPESKATYPEQWAKELLAASAPTPDNRFTDKALGYLLNNAEAFDTLMPLIKDDALVTELQARYAAAEEQRHETPDLPGGSGAVGDAEGSPAAAAPAKEIPESALPSPQVATEAAGGQQNSAGSPAVPPKAVPEAPEPSPPAPAPAPEKQGPQPIPMPLSAKTQKPDSAAYLIALQKEMTDAASQPEHIDMILAREGYLGPRKYTPGSNLATIMTQTSGSIEMFATRRKQALANVQA